MRTTTSAIPHDDRVLPYTRGLSLAIVPFLLAAFGVLYVFPRTTGTLFAWTIPSSMTARTLGSAYLGGAYFFLRVLREKRWHVIKAGFVAVAVFATLLGVATIVHWDKFHHGQVPFWIWTTLYFIAPFLVLGAWFANRQYAAATDAGERRVGRLGRAAVAVIGLLALAQGATMFLAPQTVIAIWPWPLTPLTCRVIGAIFCLGCAGLVVLVDGRWTTLRLMIQVAILMIGLILIAVVPARAEFDLHRPLSWLLLTGFVGVLVAAILAWYAVEVRGRRPTTTP